MQSFLQDIQDLITFLEQYKLAIMFAGGWFLHKFIPYCKDNGGLKTVIQAIWYNPTVTKEIKQDEKVTSIPTAPVS